MSRLVFRVVRHTLTTQNTLSRRISHNCLFAIFCHFFENRKSVCSEAQTHATKTYTLIFLRFYNVLDFLRFFTKNRL